MSRFKVNPPTATPGVHTVHDVIDTRRHNTVIASSSDLTIAQTMCAKANLLGDDAYWASDIR